MEATSVQVHGWLRGGLQRPRVVASTGMTNCHRSSLPPASFQASHATPNTNKLKCWAHYSGTHNLTCSSDLTCICESASARDIHYMSATRTSIALLLERKSKSTTQPLSSPPACLACPTAPVSLLLTLDPIICRLRQQHAPLEGMRRLASLQQY